MTSFFNNKMEEKGEALRQRFEKRQEARKQELQKKKADSASKSDENETAEAFNKSFAKETAEISELLTGLDGACLNKSQLTSKFDEMKRRMQNLQKFLTNSVMFLTSYNVRQAQENLQKLDTEINEKRDKLIPRKKFAFKQRAKAGESNELNKKEDKNERKDKKIEKQEDENEDSFGFHDCKNSELVLTADECKQKDVKLSNLTSCQIKIYGCPSALHVNNLSDCKILCGPICRPAFVTNCNDCEFSLACQQLRIHTTNKSKFYIHVTGKAIIEDCSKLGFAPYNWKYPNMNKDFVDSGLKLDINKWNDIDDFNWLKFDEHSPNWYAISEEERSTTVEK